MLQDGRAFQWAPGQDRPVARRIYSVPLTDALDDLAWGLLLGQLLYASEPEVREPWASLGIDHELIEQLRQILAPGRSGLVVVGDEDCIAQLGRAVALAETEGLSQSPL